ncbi:MAG: hypothetical protein P4M01_09250 [Acidobacteriota bacterium]|nr:hypothetical protein [Acidobacteriota bacterium]
MPEGITGSRHRWLLYAAGLLLLLAPSFFAVSRQSLWPDEAASAYFAGHAALFQLPGAQDMAMAAQMPGYHVLLTLWVRLFGDSEFALRAMNLPFAALFLVSLLALAGRGGWSLVVPFAFYPLLIYYVNECRPYVAVMACTAAALACLERSRRDNSPGLIWACAGFLLAAFCLHLLGALALGFVFVYCLLDGETRRWLLGGWRNYGSAVAVLAVASAGLLGYYRGLGISQAAATAAAATGRAPSGWKNAAFFFYEVLGFDGLGPPRNQMRAGGNATLFLPYSGWMALGALAALFLAVVFVHNWRSRTKRAALLMAGSMSAAILLALAGLTLGARALSFSFLGRHAMPLAAGVCSVLLLALRSEKNSALRLAGWTLLLVTWGASSAHLVMSYPYGKDDARTALQIARDSKLPILWNADGLNANYYNGCEEAVAPSLVHPLLAGAGTHWVCTIPLRILDLSGGVYAGRVLRSLPRGRYVLVLGKQDIYDPQGALREAIADAPGRTLAQLNGYQVRELELH